jgi:hypothetical protein
MSRETESYIVCDLPGCQSKLSIDSDYTMPEDWVSVSLPPQFSQPSFYVRSRQDKEYCCIAHAAVDMANNATLQDMVEAAKVFKTT